MVKEPKFPEDLDLPPWMRGKKPGEVRPDFRGNVPQKPLAGSEAAGKYDYLVLETNMLAKVSYVPFLKYFPQYVSVNESGLLEEWDLLLTIAMTGVAAFSKKILSDSRAIEELKSSLDKKLPGGRLGFEDYYEYITHPQIKESGVSLSGLSAMWVGLNLQGLRKANDNLKRNASKIDFVNPLSLFMNISFGQTESRLVCPFEQYFVMVCQEFEEKDGIDMGLKTPGTKKDDILKIKILNFIFEDYAYKTVKLISERMR